MGQGGAKAGGEIGGWEGRVEEIVGAKEQVDGIGIELLEAVGDGGGGILKRGENEGRAGGGWGIGRLGFRDRGGGHGRDLGIEALNEFAIGRIATEFGGCVGRKLYFGGGGWLGLGLGPGAACGEAVGQIEGDGSFAGFGRTEEQGDSAMGDTVGDEPGRRLRWAEVAGKRGWLDGGGW